LDPNGSSSSGVFEVDPLTGQASQIGQLQAPLHDAAGAVLNGSGYIFGGGSAVPTTTAERLANLGTQGVPTSTTSQPAPASALKPLPQARADDSAVTIGSTAYVVGGYSGPSADGSVLATTNGGGYSTVANLPVPVRYAAVAALGGKIYVFGGDAASGPHSGNPLTTVQVIDPAKHSATLDGNLPLPLAGAAAAVLNGTIYLAGGETPTAGSNATVHESGAIYAWSPVRRQALAAGHLFVPVAHAGVAVLGSRAWLVGGETAPNQPTADVQMLEPNRLFGTAGAPGAGSPYYGDTLLIADRGNDRLLTLNDQGQITWRYPGPGEPPPPGGFYYPDDAFFTHHGHAIISNQENNETIVQISYPQGKVFWTYGHPRQPGSLPGYLNNPDDAYLLKNGDITVADPMNCRVLVISPAKKVLTQIGTPGTCMHQPPTYLGSPNGDTPLANGNLLVSEINGSWIDEFTPTGHLLWATHLAIGYPSDPQPLPDGNYLVANYELPGGFIEFNQAGKILWSYAPTSGPGELDQPSLVEQLPSGVLMANDDYNNRMMAIDPATGALVWQYGHDGVAGSAPGYLKRPDGFDILGPNGTFPTHPPTG
jgi:outer membrane protein assembly factor BamB